MIVLSRIARYKTLGAHNLAPRHGFSILSTDFKVNRSYYTILKLVAKSNFCAEKSFRFFRLAKIKMGKVTLLNNSAEF